MSSSGSMKRNGANSSAVQQPGKYSLKQRSDTTHDRKTKPTSKTNMSDSLSRQKDEDSQGQVTYDPVSNGTGIGNENHSSYNMGYGMGGNGMGMGGYGMGMGGYGMGMGGYGMGMDGVMAPLMNQLMMVQSLNYTLMSFGQIVQSLGINAGSILQFGQSILRTLDALAIAIKKSGILSNRSSAATGSVQQLEKHQRLRARRRAVLLRWALVMLTMAVTSQVMRILQCFSNSLFPSSLAQHVFQFFRSFFPQPTSTLPGPGSTATRGGTQQQGLATC
mmetsp:Transcript_3147/g.5730  ORF Transcript_3147/g.5730 Transcript_3147/m.5730 type:complete len:276 (+) Transcript_3147:26-853(+)